MKKLFFTLFSVSSLFALINAQPCGGDGPSVCTPTGGPASGGFQDPNTIVCAIQGTPYTYTTQFTMFSQFNFQGQQQVDSIEFVSIGNLPCGLCWAVNKANKRYVADEDGCLTISGTTNDPVGQYKFALSLKAWINGNPVGITVPPSLVDQTGIALYIRVKSGAPVLCPNVDTSANANNLTASASCPVGINELAGSISEFKIMPSPMNSQATVSFYAEKQGNFTLRVTDVTGKEVIVSEMEVKQGYNTAIIDRNGLPAGLYFLNVSDGKNVVTKRFSIAD
ncbi:MAG: T9SS type A sorting domain-containing protein [Chitinophagales bacterium]|nr:T9SS type A sorting domain-containing protein [Chitinophagales bacterium]